MKSIVFLWVFIMSIVNAAPLLTESHCSLCQSSVLENQKFYEDDYVSVLYDYKPIIQGHCLVVPKRHVEHLQDLNDAEMLSIHRAVKELFSASQKAYQSDSYLILQKNGKAAGQSVPHVHVHFFPRKENDYTDLGLLARFYISSFKSPLSQDQIDTQRDLLLSCMPVSQEPVLIAQ